MRDERISDLVEELIRAASVPDYKAKAEVERALKATGQAAIPHVLPLLRHMSVTVRRAAAELMIALGDCTAVDALAHCVMDEDEFVASNAAGALGRIGDRGAVASLAAGLKHPDYGVRARCAEALGKIGDPQARPALLQALNDHPVQPLFQPNFHISNVRSAVESALVQIPEQAADPQTIPELIALFDDELVSVRARAASAVALVGSAAVEPLLAAYRTHKESVRRSVAQALSEIKDPIVVPTLLQIAERDSSLYVRREAATGLLNRNDAREHHNRASAILAG